MTYTRTRTILEIGKLYKFQDKTSIFRIQPDIITSQISSTKVDIAQEVVYMSEVLKLQKTNKIEVELGQVILALANEMKCPNYIGQTYGKWGNYYYKDNVLGAVVLFEDKECWLPEEDFCFLERM